MACWNDFVYGRPIAWNGLYHLRLPALPECRRDGLNDAGGGISVSGTERGRGAKPKVVWTIAGFDASSGAGVTADLMTFAAHGLFGCSVPTALTVQSTMGVAEIEAVRPAFFRHSVDHLFLDLPPSGVKIGMVGGPETAAIVGDFLRRMQESSVRVSPVPVVYDPVLRSSSGRELYPGSEMHMLHDLLLPEVDWLTPNWGELAVLTATSIATLTDAERAARLLLARYPKLNVVVTGGDQASPTELMITSDGEIEVLSGEHIATTSTHGTGCAFSSALLAGLVNGLGAEKAVREAKAYVAGALRHAPGLGGGKGPLDLLWPLTVL